jgi:hypothetical protein
MNPYALKPLGYQQIVGLAAATALTVPAGTCMIQIQAEAQAVRWRDDGVDPTAAVGMPVATGVLTTYYGGTPTTLKFIEQALGATLNVTYYGKL